MPRWGSRSAALPGAVGIDRQTFRDLDNLVEDLKYNQRAFQQGENILIRMLAETQKGIAQRKSAGPVGTMSSTGTSSSHVGGTRSGILGTKTGTTLPGGRPFGIPVRRITGEYYRGWKVRKIAPAMWMTYNDSREAFFIEFGINPRVTGAVRRPILKMSAIATLRFIQRTKLIERFAKTTIGATRNQRGQYRSFQARMSGSTLLGVIGPEGNLPG